MSFSDDLMSKWEEAQYRKLRNEARNYSLFANSDPDELRMELDRRSLQAPASDTGGSRMRMTVEGGIMLKKAKYYRLLESWNHEASEISITENEFVRSITAKIDSILPNSQLTADCERKLSIIIDKKMKQYIEYRKQLYQVQGKYGGVLGGYRAVPPPDQDFLHVEPGTPVLTGLILRRAAMNRELEKIVAVDTSVRDQIHSRFDQRASTYEHLMMVDDVYTLLLKNLQKQMQIVGDPSLYINALNSTISSIASLP